MHRYTASDTSYTPTWTWYEPIAPRIFLPEVVRRELGADVVYHWPSDGLWQLTVWFGQPDTTLDPHPESIAYTAQSNQGFTTEEAIDAIRQQRPEPPDYSDEAAHR